MEREEGLFDFVAEKKHMMVVHVRGNSGREVTNGSARFVMHHMPAKGTGSRWRRGWFDFVTASFYALDEHVSMKTEKTGCCGCEEKLHFMRERLVWDVSHAS